MEDSSSSSSSDTLDEKRVEEVLDVKKLLSKNNVTLERNSLIEVDLGNLLAIDKQEYNQGFDVKAVTETAVQELFAQLFQLPIQADEFSSDPLAQLPKGKMPIPREKPVPVAKPLTKWEQYAKDQGIQKKKKSKIVYDEIAKEYRPRYGFNRPLDPKQDWVLPDKPGELSEAGVQDPFELNQAKRKKASAKIQKHQEANQKRRLKEMGLGNKKQVTLELHNNARVEKDVLDRALTIAQKSTASMGKFDKLNPGEKKVKRKPEYVPDNAEDRRRVETRIVERVIKNQEASIDAKKAGNQLMMEEQRQNKHNKQAQAARDEERKAKKRKGGHDK